MDQVMKWLKSLMHKQTTDMTGWWKVGTSFLLFAWRPPFFMGYAIAQAVTGFSVQKLGFDPKAVPAEFMVPKWQWGRFFYRHFSLSFIPSVLLICLFIIWGSYSEPLLWPHNHWSYCCPTQRINFHFHVNFILLHVWMLPNSCVTQKSNICALHELVSACFLLQECRIKS